MLLAMVAATETELKQLKISITLLLEYCSFRNVQIMIRGLFNTHKNELLTLDFYFYIHLSRMISLQTKPIILFLAVTAVATRANIFLDSSINSPSDRLWNVLALVQTITTEVIAKTLCYSVVPTDIFAVIQAFTPITTTIKVTISTIENPGNCRKRRWAFENAIDGRLFGPNDIIATSANANPR
ncbi:hypothetical protein QYM36_004067 [Artemia franciscana]|uniref:Uncharacterized protein n=1 Tax=Artemia franciscana TaxID=6661 RepID=A0AA88L688_ARTSF|nr:hypothetical protein QYM36_004067 [Artemia franciscana]